MQTARQHPQLVEPGGELVDDGVEHLPVAVDGLRAETPDRQQDRGEPLLRPVMEVALDPPPLCVGDLDETSARGAELGLGALAIGDVPQVAGERRRARQPDARDRQLDGELGAVLVHGGQLEPLVEDHRPLGLEEAREPLAMGRSQRAAARSAPPCRSRPPRARGSRTSSRPRGSSRGCGRGDPSRRRRRARPRASRAAATRSRAPRPRRAAARRTDRPGCRSRPSSRAGARRARAGSREKNSITPTTPRGLRSGKPNAACSPARRAASARGKLRSAGVSTIQLGRPDASSRPGSPSPGLERDPLAERLELRGAVAARATCTRSEGGGRPARPPTRRRAPSRATRPIASSVAA